MDKKDNYVRARPIRKFYYDDESCFGIYAFQVNKDDLNKVELNDYDNISAKGSLPKLDENGGIEYKLSLEKDTSPRARRGSYLIKDIRIDTPNSVSEQRQFLSSILTELQVEEIYNVYSEEDDVVKLIMDKELDYSKIKGIGDYIFNVIHRKVKENIELSEVLAFASKYGIKQGVLVRMLNAYKNPLVLLSKIRENPYVLTSIHGIGFKRADAIAQSMGIPADSENRIASCLSYLIELENKNGNSWITRSSLLDQSESLLGIKRDLIINYLERDHDDSNDNRHEKLSKIGNPVQIDKNIVKIANRFTLFSIYQAEAYIAETLFRLSKESNQVMPRKELDKFLDTYSLQNNIELHSKQREFFYNWNESNVNLLIGGGGTGKSWLQRILIEILEKNAMTYELMAPTGRASKVMSEYAEKPASTIHRRIGLGINIDKLEGDVLTHKVFADQIIIDETSMCDIFVTKSLLQSIENKKVRILFVGDDFQLPSVGVGNLLFDLINSNIITSTILDKVFRQKDNGMLDVITNVRNTKTFLDPSQTGMSKFGNNCTFWSTKQEYILDGILMNYKSALKHYSQHEIAVLTPTNRGGLGVVALNKKIQEIANPADISKREVTVERDEIAITFRDGDIVMNTSNLYGINYGFDQHSDDEIKYNHELELPSSDVFNGDIGEIVSINREDKYVDIDFYGKVFRFEEKDMGTGIVHAWAMTIHKSQGSQYKAVIAVIDRSSTYQLNANLIYTALSRAQERLLVLTQIKTFNSSILKKQNIERKSFLKDLLTALSIEDERKTLT